ncbi:MAG: glucokinase [Pseudomonadota bacterium]
MSTPVYAALVADIGGTNARFALAHRDAQGRLQLSDVRLLAVAEHPTLTAAIQAYLDAAGAPAAPRHAVLAVASAVKGDAVKLTNSPWTFSVSQVRAQLGFARLRVVNDFCALSMAIPHLTDADLGDLGGVAAAAADPLHRSYAAVGPGTGLGVGGLLIRHGRAAVLESEGGHLGFAPVDDYEVAILRQLWTVFERVSNERLLSGPGLLNLYHAACAIEGVRAAFDTPEAISAEADADPDGICARTVERFCALLGSVAGDVALAVGAWDGVYLGGGIALKLERWLRRPLFRARFEAKGRHAPLMRAIPTRLVRHPAVGLLGAAAFALDDQYA